MAKASIRKNGAGHAKKKTTIILGIIIIIIIQCNKQGGGAVSLASWATMRERLTILIVVVIAILN